MRTLAIESPRTDTVTTPYLNGEQKQVMSALLRTLSVNGIAISGKPSYIESENFECNKQTVKRSGLKLHLALKKMLLPGAQVKTELRYDRPAFVQAYAFVMFKNRVQEIQIGFYAGRDVIYIGIYDRGNV